VEIEATLVFEKQAPKSRAFGVRTEEGVLIKIWVPNDLVGKDVTSLEIALDIPEGKKKKNKKGKAKAEPEKGRKGKAKKSKRDEDEDEDEDDEDDEEEDDDEDDDEEED
jgi:hypothetical protein